jgi:hypothetical protein
MAKRLVAVLALLVLVAVGCGGDDGSGGGGEASSDRSDEPAEDEGPSEDEYAEEVSDLCGDWFSDVLDADGSIREIAEEVSGTAEDLAADLEDVEAPEDLEEDVEELDTALDDYSGFLSDLAEGLAETEELYGGSAEVTGLSPTEQEDVISAREDLVDAFEAVDADCGFDEAETDLAPFQGDVEDEPAEPTEDTVAEEPSTGPVGVAVLPDVYIAEYGTDAGFDALADQCYDGDLAACDELYRTTPVAETLSSYEGYGSTCGGRVTQELDGQCEASL